MREIYEPPELIIICIPPSEQHFLRHIIYQPPAYYVQVGEDGCGNSSLFRFERGYRKVQVVPSLRN